jgi:hypothetical protein
MKNPYSVKDKIILILLATAVVCFGVVLPDSLSDHDKLVHFSAHFGMSFLLALCFYMFCTIKIKISKSLSYTLLILGTLIIGVIYKYWEIASQNVFHRFDFSTAIEITGVPRSMSQNLSGLMAAILFIEGLVHRNLIMSAIRSGNFHFGSGSFKGDLMKNRQPAKSQGFPHANVRPSGIQFSPEASDK